MFVKSYSTGPLHHYNIRTEAQTSGAQSECVCEVNPIKTQIGAGYFRHTQSLCHAWLEQCEVMYLDVDSV